MKYKLFGSPKCARCKKARKAIERAGHEVEYHDASEHDKPQPGWRDRPVEFVDFKASLCLDGQLTLPVIFKESDEADVWILVEYEDALKCG